MSSSDQKPGADYEVGYGKPPLHTRFQPGRSGNPRGRPPKSRNLKTLLAEALAERVVVVENGRRKKKTKREVIIAQLVNKSTAADFKAISLVLGLMQQVERDHQIAEPEEFAEADHKVLRNLQLRFGGTRSEDDV